MPTWSEEDLGASGEEGSGEPEPIPAKNPPPSKPAHELVPQRQLEHQLALANDPESLKQLSDKVAAVHELARRMDLTLEELNRLAETRLRVARKLGDILHRSVRRGGKSKSHDVTSTWGGSPSPLPEGITRMQSSRLQHIADISEERFEQYVKETRERRASITAAGLLRAARRYAAGSTQVQAGEAPAEAYWERVWDAVTRVMDLDVCVGVSGRKLGAPKSLRLKQAMQAQLSGNVLVRTTNDVEPWLKTLAHGRERRGIVEAMILFVPRTGLAWFRLVDTGGWICCFLENPGSPSRAYALAYHGERQHAFCLVFRELGAVLRAPQF